MYQRPNRHGPRRRAIHDFSLQNQHSRGWRAFARHDAVEASVCQCIGPLVLDNRESVQSATPAMARQGSRTAMIDARSNRTRPRCAISDGARLLSRPATNASHRRQTRHQTRKPPRFMPQGLLRFRLCRSSMMFPHNTVHPGQIGRIRCESGCRRPDRIPRSAHVHGQQGGSRCDSPGL